MSDEHYTSIEIMDAVRDYVEKTYGVSRDNFVRPFYPGGDYESYEYPAGCIVVDNPPFSIEKNIMDFYVENDIKFFLFCSGRSYRKDVLNKKFGLVVNGSIIRYYDGFEIDTNFVTNIDNKIRLMHIECDSDNCIFKACKAHINFDYPKCWDLQKMAKKGYEGIVEFDRWDSPDGVNVKYPDYNSFLVNPTYEWTHVPEEE